MRLLNHFLCLTLATNFGAAFAATIGTTTGSDFTTASWTNSSSTSYGTFYQVANPGSSFAIGDSSQGGRTSIGSKAFNLIPGSYTNTGFLGYAQTYYVLSGGALSVGQTLSFDINFLFSNGTKGFTLEKAGGGANSDLFTVRQDWGDSIQALKGGLVGTNNIVSNGFQKALRLEATQQAESIQLNIKDGGTSIFSQTFLTTDTIGQIQFFAGNIDPTQEGDRDSQSIFFNNISVIPEPSALSLLTIGSLGLLVLRRRLKA